MIGPRTAWPPTAVVLSLIMLPAWISAQDKSTRPNILVAIAEDCSWLHFSAYGNKVVNTPAFDRVAREGVLFRHAFCSEPTCSPSRAAILTGQQFWRLENAAVFWRHAAEQVPRVSGPAGRRRVPYRLQWQDVGAGLVDRR